jgi:NAD(P)-dependent dehydrogenase (short-subunit alcohol dehydrogenase family)
MAQLQGKVIAIAGGASGIGAAAARVAAVRGASLREERESVCKRVRE